MAPKDTGPPQQPITEKEVDRVHSDGSSETAHEAPAGGHPATHFASKEQVVQAPTVDNGKTELTEDDCYEELGFSYTKRKKWTILTVIFLVQTSMNFNTSLYSNALGGISSEFSVSEQAARVGAAIFLVTYAFGCELWAPWSEGEHLPYA